MQRFTTRWTTAVAAAAFLALPVAAPPSPPAAATAARRNTAGAATPRPQQTTTTQPAGRDQVDANAAKKHLSDARDTLSQVTSMPEAAKLQGDARTQVSQLISNFNELITTQSDWRAAYAKVDANLTTLLGPEAPDQAHRRQRRRRRGRDVGSAARPRRWIPRSSAKLAEFRTHLKVFEQAAGGDRAGRWRRAADGRHREPRPVRRRRAASGVRLAGTPLGPAADQPKAAEQGGSSEANKHLDAICAILAKSTTGTLTKAQTDELKKHVAELRALLSQRR